MGTWQSRAVEPDSHSEIHRFNFWSHLGTDQSLHLYQSLMFKNVKSTIVQSPQYGCVSCIGHPSPINPTGNSRICSMGAP
jgi:hypothetical protein